MRWQFLDNDDDLKALLRESHEQPCLIFKNSTRCSISQMALHRLERSWQAVEGVVKPFMVDVISNRSLSNQVADTFNVVHESPQVLLIKDGQCIYDTSHNAISVDRLQEQLLAS